MALSPRWGDGATGTGASWQDQFYDRNLLGTAQERWALDAYGNYRVRLPSGELLNGLQLQPVALRTPLPVRGTDRRAWQRVLEGSKSASPSCVRR